MTPVALKTIDDLGVRWDAEASRLARVLVSEGRIEIVLCEMDMEWVEAALERVGPLHKIAIVIASPDFSHPRNEGSE